MRHNHPQEYIGVDVGSRRVGIARGSSVARIAQPLKIVPAEHVIEELVGLAARADGIVVGLPRGLDSQETAQTSQVREWVKQAKAVVKKPFYWQDEALTSVNAVDDAAAAALILQDFLNSLPEDRVKI